MTKITKIAIAKLKQYLTKIMMHDAPIYFGQILMEVEVEHQTGVEK